MPAVLRCLLLSLFALTHVDAAGHYEVSLASAASGSLRVSLDAECAGQSAELQMPVWNATYHVRDFSRFVTNFSVRDKSGAALDVSKPNPSRWVVSCSGDRHMRVGYDVLANRPGPFGAFADSSYATLNLAQILLYPTATRAAEFSLAFADLSQGQKVAITLQKEGENYHAPNYDLLIDTPVLIGNFVEESFEYKGTEIRVVAYGQRGGFDLNILIASVAQIVKGSAEIMGELPLTKYTFVYCFRDITGGGMEYRNGTIIFGPAECPNCRLSSLTAHEFFHLWNVKRIRPSSLEPVDYERPMPTPSLWFAEGVTSTFAEYIRLKSGASVGTEFLSHLGTQISSYLERSARLEQSAEQGSVEAWLEGYPEYGSPKRSVSYYLRGELIGYLLDLAIRQRTQNRRALDDVLRLMNERYAIKGRPYEDTAAIERALTDVAETDMGDVMEKLVRRPEPIDWNEFLGYAGYRLSKRQKEKVDLGFALSNAPGRGIVVSEVELASPAERAGFRVGDRIVRFQSRRITGGPEALAFAFRRSVGRKVSVGVMRQGSLIEIEITPRTSEAVTYRIVPVAQPTGEQLRVRDGWLKRTTSPHFSPPDGGSTR